MNEMSEEWDPDGCDNCGAPFDILQWSSAGEPSYTCPKCGYDESSGGIWTLVMPDEIVVKRKEYESRSKTKNK